MCGGAILFACLPTFLLVTTLDYVWLVVVTAPLAVAGGLFSSITVRGIDAVVECWPVLNCGPIGFPSPTVTEGT
jgi:hypothetical protein